MAEDAQQENPDQRQDSGKTKASFVAAYLSSPALLLLGVVVVLQRRRARAAA